MTGRVTAVGEERLLWAFEPGAHLHLVGIGGIGLSAIAHVLLQRGYVISGSDIHLSPITRDLVRQGATIYEGHRRKNVSDANAVIISSAIREGNPEVLAAVEEGTPVFKRGQALAWLMKGRTGIAVAGTHGKTTVSAMIGLILWRANLDPTIVVGGIVPELGSNAMNGNGQYFVVEADEYDRTFLHLTPQVVVVTNIEMDHPDCFLDLEDMIQTFDDFLDRVPANGLVVACGDDAHARRAVNDLSHSAVATYGLGTDVDWRAMDLQQNPLGGTDFRVVAGGEQKGWFQLSVPGNHNVSNAVAAIVITDHLGVEPAISRDTLKQFKGVGRRFEVKGEVQGITVVDDYAHHPTEIRATLAGAGKRYGGQRLWVVFQPHTHSRTKALLGEFAAAFEDADRVLVTPVYAARETNTLGIGSGDLVSMMNHPGAEYVASLSEATSFLAKQLVPGDVLITMGAGDVWRVGEDLLAALGYEDDDSGREA